MKTENIAKNLTFYIGNMHTDFVEKIKTELQELEQRDIHYVIFRRSDKILPRLCADGYCVAGMSHIKEELNNILSA